MMPTIIRLPYLVRFAARDLTDRTSWATTTAAVVTIATAVGFAVLSRGLSLGAYRVQVSRLDHDPSNRTLWFGTDSMPKMTPALCKELDRAIKAALPPGGLEGVYPFSRVGNRADQRWLWMTADGTTPLNFVGRTLRPDDRFLESYTRPGGSPPPRLTATTRGIVVAPSMLRSLGYPDPDGPDPPPPPVTIKLQRSHGREPLDVPLLGISRAEFPSFPYVDFLVGESYEAELRQKDWRETLKEFRTGPVPEAWAVAARDGRLPADLVRLIGETKRLRLPTAIPIIPDGSAWVLANDRGDVFDPDLAEWREHLRDIVEVMNRTPGFPRAPDFLKTPAGQQPARPEVSPIVEHRYVAVVVNQVEALPLAARAAREVLREPSSEDWAVPLNEGATAEVIKLIAQTSQAIRLMTIFSIGIAVVAVINLLAVEWLRAERKLPEWGMLKAVGMTGPQLSRLALLEGAALGAFAAAIGIGSSDLIGRIIGRAYYGGGSSDATIGFADPPEWLALPFVVAIAVCALGTLWASQNARSWPPCESLRSR